MTKLKISFTNTIEADHLEGMGRIHGYKSMVPNPEFNPDEPQSDLNPMQVKSKITPVEFAINKLAEMTGDLVTHEVTFPIMDDISPKELQEKKQDVIKELQKNFILKVETI